jgi:hypothetical protein
MNALPRHNAPLHKENSPEKKGRSGNLPPPAKAIEPQSYGNDEGKRLYNDYVKALQELKEIYGRRRKQLDATRKNFKNPEIRIDNSLSRHNGSPRKIRGYERRVDAGLIRQSRER